MSKYQVITVAESLDNIGNPVTIRGWVHTVRDMGQIAFIELRDHTGILQLVEDDIKKLPKLGQEYVIEVSGTVRERGERYVNKKLLTGTVELGLDTVAVLNESIDLPFEVKKDTSVVNEELRLKHRYLDLRNDRMAGNLKLRHRVIKFIRDYYDQQGFIEVETPLLTKGTPEGAREFLVPSRLHAENFYVLPQSPQQFKQLLMVGGIGRYFQIARCLRDEDQRGDRQPEFTQLDVEMSFVSQENILQLTEEMVIALVKSVAPEKPLKAPFPRLTYAEAMEKYKSDKPDLRKNKKDDNELAFVWVTDFPLFEINAETSKLDAVHHPFTRPIDEDLDRLGRKSDGVRAAAYDLVLNGYEIGGGSLRIHERELQEKIFKLLGLDAKEINERFGHLLEAFKYGAPPHGGIALGLDRLIMILAGEPNIREVMAFPKTGDARDPLTGAPASMPAKRQAEVHIKTIPSKG
ncbi:MAG TPA: aspartate--tRNA ligase [Candidatus Saccharimonadales bacterium]|nr:aspartate--tRNA ligase [Candidatus Saccharimonadales bacterium]